MSAQKNRFEYSMLLIIFGGGIFLAALIWTIAATEGEYLLMGFCVIVAFIQTMFFEYFFCRLTAPGDLLGKDDDKEDGEES